MSEEIDWNDDEAVVRAAFGEVYGMNSTHHFPDWKEARKYPTVMEWERAHRPAPVEGVVLPERPSYHQIEQCTGDTLRYYTVDFSYKEDVEEYADECERQLREAIAERDEARTELKRTSIDLREEIAAIRRSWKFEWNRAEKAEAALATARAQGREEGLREALEFVQRERLDNHEDAIACIPGVHETDTSYSNAIRDAENVIISLIPNK